MIASFLRPGWTLPQDYGLRFPIYSATYAGCNSQNKKGPEETLKSVLSLL